MENPFETIAKRLSNIEDLLLDLKHKTPQGETATTEPYGDFKWLAATCPSIPASTLRIKSASGEIPGVIKFGKRVLYEKATVINWFRGQIHQPIEASVINQSTNAQINQQLAKRGGRRSA